MEDSAIYKQTAEMCAVDNDSDCKPVEQYVLDFH